MTIPSGSISQGSITQATAAHGEALDVGGLPPAPEPAFVFSAGGLLAWVQLQLAQFDAQVGDLMSGIKQRKAESARDSGFAANLRAAKGLSGQALDDWCAARRKEHLTPEQLALVDKVERGKLSKDRLETEAQRFDAAAGSATSSTDVDMIRLQALIASRSQALSFASNGIAGINETSKAIIGNVRA